MRYKIEQFAFNPGTQNYSQEASMLHVHSLFGTLPSGEKGIIVDDVEFMFTGVDRDAGDEDIYGWWFTPTMGAITKNPNFAGKKVLIIND